MTKTREAQRLATIIHGLIDELDDRRCPQCGRDVSGRHKKAVFCNDVCKNAFWSKNRKRSPIRSAEQRRRADKLKREQAAYEKFKALVMEIHNRDAVEIAQEVYERLARIWNTENIYICEKRAVLRRSYNIHTANKNMAMLEKERKEKHG